MPLKYSREGLADAYTENARLFYKGGKKSLPYLDTAASTDMGDVFFVDASTARLIKRY